MEPLILKAQEDTPEVCFDGSSGRCKIAGNSMPENAVKFYAPIFQWVSENITCTNNRVVLELYFEYFNSSTAKAIFDLIMKLASNNNLEKVEWKYNSTDDMIKGRGEELKEITKVNFEIIEVC